MSCYFVGASQKVSGNAFEVLGVPQNVSDNAFEVLGAPQKVSGNAFEALGVPQMVSGSACEVLGTSQKVFAFPAGGGWVLFPTNYNVDNLLYVRAVDVTVLVYIALLSSGAAAYLNFHCCNLGISITILRGIDAYDICLWHSIVAIGAYC